LRRVRKRLLFENKKKQKNFIHCKHHCRDHIGTAAMLATGESFFASFFSKKEDSCLPLPPPHIPVQSAANRSERNRP
jgi:hypothetical protein